jgi:hypothetical protein
VKPASVQSRIRRTAQSTAVALGALLVGAAAASAQCAMCQGSASATQGGGAGYNLSTLWMLAVPYALVLGIGGYVALAFRAARRGAGSPPGSSGDDPTEDPE